MAVDYKDYYKILGLPKTATDKEIKAAYRTLARKHHPDVNAGDKKSEDTFKDIGEAYDVLSDADKRAKYDQFGDQWKAHSHGGGPSYGNPQGGVQYTTTDFGGAGFDDFLSSLFGGAGGIGGQSSPFGGGFGRANPAQTRTSQDAEYPIEISLEEAYKGTSKSFTVSLPETCRRCGGSGAVSAGKSKPCPLCSGTGKTKSGRGLFGNNVCPQCGGSGEAVEVCPECHGEGEVNRQKKLSDVKIPAGVGEGQRIRLAGQGAGGGDLFLKVSIRPDSRFERDGSDLTTEFVVPFTVAALGGEAHVATFNGDKTLRVPPGTQSGQKFRLTGQGMPILKSKGGGNGSLYARAKVSVPKDLTPREKELLTELASLRSDSVNV